MSLVNVHTTLMLPEALVIASMLEAHGMRVMTAGKDIIAQCPQFAILVGGVSICVDEADAPAARALIRSGEDVPGYKSLQSDGFEKKPIRNALLAFLILILGAPFPFWYRGSGSREGPV